MGHETKSYVVFVFFPPIRSFELILLKHFTFCSASWCSDCLITHLWTWSAWDAWGSYSSWLSSSTLHTHTHTHTHTNIFIQIWHTKRYLNVARRREFLSSSTFSPGGPLLPSAPCTAQNEDWLWYVKNNVFTINMLLCSVPKSCMCAWVNKLHRS